MSHFLNEIKNYRGRLRMKQLIKNHQNVLCFHDLKWRTKNERYTNPGQGRLANP